MAEAMMAQVGIGEDAPAVVDGMLAQHAALARELEDECDTDLERLLARRVAVAWLWVAVADIHLAQAQQAAGVLRKLTRPARSSLIVLKARAAKAELPALRTPGGDAPAPPLPLAWAL